MAKHKITVRDKQEIRNIIFTFIEEQDNKFKYKEYIEKVTESLEKYLQEWLYTCFNQSEEVLRFINQYELSSKNSYGYGYIKTGHDDNEIRQHFALNLDVVWDLRCKMPITLPDLYKDLIQDSSYCNNLQEILFTISKEESEKISLEIQKREKEFMKIYSNFKNILYSCKYLEDVGKLIPLPEVVKYIENKLLTQCTTLAPINKENINFVDNYIKNIKKA